MVFTTNPKIIRHVYDNIPYMFDCWAKSGWKSPSTKERLGIRQQAVYDLSLVSHNQSKSIAPHVKILTCINMNIAERKPINRVFSSNLKFRPSQWSAFPVRGDHTLVGTSSRMYGTGQPCNVYVCEGPWSSRFHIFSFHKFSFIRWNWHNSVWMLKVFQKILK